MSIVEVTASLIDVILYVLYCAVSYHILFQ